MAAVCLHTMGVKKKHALAGRAQSGERGDPVAERLSFVIQAAAESVRRSPWLKPPFQTQVFVQRREALLHPRPGAFGSLLDWKAHWDAVDGRRFDYNRSVVFRQKSNPSEGRTGRLHDERDLGHWRSGLHRIGAS